MLGPVLISLAWITMYEKKYYDIWRATVPTWRPARIVDYARFWGPGPVFLHSASLHVTNTHERDEERSDACNPYDAANYYSAN